MVDDGNIGGRTAVDDTNAALMSTGAADGGGDILDSAESGGGETFGVITRLAGVTAGVDAGVVTGTIAWASAAHETDTDAVDRHA
jgi:hypothetical protein